MITISELTFKFWTDATSYQEFGTKSEKNHYITGYISTTDIDRHNEVVTEQAMNEMLTQLKSGNIKLDIEHDTFRGKSDIPVGKIIEAKIDGKGLWIKAMLNKSHDKFETIWKSIKDGFLDAFSIAYQVKDVTEEVIDGTKVKMLKSLELLNVAITGVPVNTRATMSESFMKSMNSFVEATRPYEPEVVEVKHEIMEAEKMPEEIKVEVKSEEPQAPVEVKSELKIEDVLAELKSMQAQNVELKAEMAKLNEFLTKPQLKSIVTPSEEIKKVSDVKLKSVMELL